jgi:archaellum component FlaG (FlaF/FlaG flagellin family)
MTLEPSLTATVTDGSVTFAFRVKNTGDDPVDLRFNSGQTADVVVYDSDREVWRWAEGQMFTQMIRDTTVVPGDEIGEEFTWTNPEPGEYVAEATLAADTDATAKTSFTV